MGGGSAHRRTLSGDELSDPDNISQQRPFTAPIKDRAAADADQEGAAPAVHANPPTLNAAEIEKQLSLALQASDEAQANMLLAETGSVASLASYEDEFFHLRPKIVQVKQNIVHHSPHGEYRSLIFVSSFSMAVFYLDGSFEPTHVSRPLGASAADD